MSAGAFATAAPFAWYGGKQRLAARIAALLPPHRTYVEAFGSAAAVLCAKQPAVLEASVHHAPRLWDELESVRRGACAS